MELAVSSCSTCLFFKNAQIMGSCRRYPQMLNKHENDWCGEHTLAPMALVQMPVYDIMTDTVTEAPKRKYTRKKDAAAVA